MAGMKIPIDFLLTFLGIAAIIGGLVLIATYMYQFSSYEAPTGFFGVILLAAGLTRVWMKSRFYRKD